MDDQLDPSIDTERPKPKMRGITLKFASPLSVTMIENIGEIYIRAVLYATGMGLSHVFIGAVLTCIVIYGAHCRDDHAMFCGFGYHFFIVEGILSLSYINGWATPLRSRHRRLAHVFLQVCGFTCAAFGIAQVTIREGLSTTFHGLSGAALAVLTVLTFMVGPFLLKNVHMADFFHVALGIPTFVMSGVCCCSGLIKPEFTHWASVNLVRILIGFIVFYCTLITITTIMKCLKRI
ncbi:unnamed protein product [Chrysodeixis includens]|uniref:Cytochrome b561 domain-containing protein n=1 Tax=Chrysodeixis includens TaxID=689277 RepID=A0A9P0C665_CHRIL|nr:unnamed protein product [Chrysodeixis includens]